MQAIVNKTALSDDKMPTIIVYYYNKSKVMLTNLFLNKLVSLYKNQQKYEQKLIYQLQFVLYCQGNN